MKKLKIKVCGMTNSLNIKRLLELKPDFVGFIFYDKSPRNVLNGDAKIVLNTFPETIKKVGVFVDESTETIQSYVDEYNLDFVQLHGNETPEFCSFFKNQNIGVIKAFSIDKDFDFNFTEAYTNAVDYFLFDTKAKGYGGHGFSFDWQLIDNYKFEVPFLLAGGVSVDKINEIELIKHKQLVGIDVNSKFEIMPGIKDIEALKTLFDYFR